LNAAALAIAVASPSHNPQNVDATTTAGRYTTLRETTGATSASG
jgi:hypothetical protein